MLGQQTGLQANDDWSKMKKRNQSKETNILKALSSVSYCKFFYIIILSERTASEALNRRNSFPMSI